MENLHVLASHGGRLPAAWFTPDFLASTVHVAETLFKSSAPKELEVKGLGAIAALWSFWIRKSGKSSHWCSLIGRSG